MSSTSNMNLNLNTQFDQKLRAYFECPEDANTYVKQLEELSEKTLSSKMLAKLHGRLGMHLLFLNKYEQAKNQLAKSLKIIEENSLDLQLKVQQQIRWATLLQWEGKYYEADILFLKLIEVCNKKENCHHYLDFCYQHYGKSLFEQEKYNQALEYLRKALELRKIKDNKELIESTEMAIQRIRTITPCK